MRGEKAVSALALLGFARAAIQEHWWNISYATANPDGLFPRRVIGVNGTWPPPALVATQGDTFLVHATNGLGDNSIGTALHSHGMFFNGTNYYDGAVGVTQCSIPSGETLDYYIDTSLQTGTYWIHGHYSGQYVDGLRAPLVIMPKNGTGRADNTTWDDEYTLIVGDWYHDEHPILLSRFLNWRNPTGAEPVPDAAAIYVMHNGTYYPSAEDVSSGAAVNDNATIAFEPGKKYKIRIINMSALAMFHIAIDQHNMSIIEADGVEMTPFPTDVITISVGQRYSILVEAKNETNVNYAMSVMQDTDMYDAVPDALVLNNTVQIVYSSNNTAAQPATYDEYPELVDTNFVPIISRASAPADIEYRLDVFFDTYDNGINRASFNNITYQEPPTPSIFTALSMGNNSFLSQVYGAQTNVFAYPHLANIQLTVYNWDAGFHPFHLHGHEFQVISKSFDVTSNDTSINPPVIDEQENPARRDTITIPPTGNVVLRWRADNPGAWFFHCHIDFHLSSGLAAVFVEAPEKFQEKTAVPTVFYDQCKEWGRGTSGNVVGLNSTTDFTGQPWGPFPIVMGWTPKAIGAMAGCILTALVGIGSVIWYGWGPLDEHDVEDEIKRKVEAKLNKKSWFSKVTGRA